MVMLLEAAKDSERTFRESLSYTSHTIKPLIDGYIARYNENDMFNIIKNAPEFHNNPILIANNGSVFGNENTFESKGCNFLRKCDIQQFYDDGFIAQTYKFPNLRNIDLQRIEKEYVEHNNKCRDGIYDSVYGKFPDYVAHLYMSSVVKLLKDNYEFIVQQAMSIFNKPEEELFFQVGIFMVDQTGKGANVHQDYSYYFLDQVVISLHLAVSNSGLSRFYLFPKTHKEILHNLTTLRYLLMHKIPVDEEMALYCGGISEYIINKNRLPYNDPDGLVMAFSHFSRYLQQVYILNRYKDNDIVGHKVDTKPGEFVLFDPAILHSNGASSGNIEEVIKIYGGVTNADDISRLSLAIRVMHTKNDHDHFLWMSAPEKTEVLKKFFDVKCQENKVLLSGGCGINLNKIGNEFYTVLSNNKKSSPNSGYFSIDEMYQLHAQSGAYRN
jgi:hypothetical protein